jgi:hypothetical protein
VTRRVLAGRAVLRVVSDAVDLDIPAFLVFAVSRRYKRRDRGHL